jgi:2,5-dihydroxypyridine 5,6-dioxygenase
MSSTTDARLQGTPGLFARELELCAVKPEETVIVYGDDGGRADLFSGFSLAAQLLGATVLELRAPRRPRMPGEEGADHWWTTASNPIERALKLADLVVDVSSGGLFHAGQDEILAAGTRILRAREPMRRLEALFPTPAVTDHVKASGEALAGAGTVRFTSPAGTDLTVNTAGAPLTIQHGYTDVAGRWDHFGTALAALAPAEGEGDGDYVLAPGDVVFFTATVGRTLTEPLRIHFAGGRIESMTGGIEARMLEDLIERGGGGDARRMSHLGWGCDPRADFNGVELYGREGGGGADVRSAYGTVVIAFGANNDLGGTSVTSVHVDCATRVASVELDGRQVLRDGAFQLPELTLSGVR